MRSAGERGSGKRGQTDVSTQQGCWTWADGGLGTHSSVPVFLPG
jgi:hypothetical protein